MPINDAQTGGGHSTGSPLVRTPRQGSWIAGSIPVQLIYLGLNNWQVSCGNYGRLP